MDTGLTALIAENAHRLRDLPTINRVALLHAIAECESSHGARGLATLHENAYCYKGAYFSGPNGGQLRDLTSKYGCLAHCSYSSWQIMYITAVELGFRGDPCELRNDAVAIEYVCAFINRRFLDRYPRIAPSGVADGYNSGNPYDENRPTAYVEEFMAAYNKWTNAESQP